MKTHCRINSLAVNGLLDQSSHIDQRKQFKTEISTRAEKIFLKDFFFIPAIPFQRTLSGIMPGDIQENGWRNPKVNFLKSLNLSKQSRTCLNLVFPKNCDWVCIYIFMHTHIKIMVLDPVIDLIYILTTQSLSNLSSVLLNHKEYLC